MARILLGDARRMHRLRLIVAFAVFLLSLAVTSRASAQSITVVQESSLPRLDAQGQQLPKRDLNLSPEAINAQDCRDDQRIRFPLQMSGFAPNAVVEMWASTGADCKAGPNRNGVDASCWNLLENIPLQANIAVDVPVRAVLAPAADEIVCGTVDLTMIQVQILYFAPGDRETAIVSKNVSIFADTIGPEPPRATVSPGNGRARIEIQPSSGISDLTAITAFCEKSSSPTTCSGTALIPGAEPDAAFECGTVVGSTGSVLFTDPLENGTNHVVAVAARDSVGNLGLLSSVTCATPSPDAETKVQSLDEPTGCAVSAAGARADVGSGIVLAPILVIGLALLLARGRIRARRRAAPPRR